MQRLEAPLVNAADAQMQNAGCEFSRQLPKYRRISSSSISKGIADLAPFVERRLDVPELRAQVASHIC